MITVVLEEPNTNGNVDGDVLLGFQIERKNRLGIGLRGHPCHTMSDDPPRLCVRMSLKVTGLFPGWRRLPGSTELRG